MMYLLSASRICLWSWHQIKTVDLACLERNMMYSIAADLNCIFCPTAYKLVVPQFTSWYWLLPHNNLFCFERGGLCRAPTYFKTTDLPWSGKEESENYKQLSTSPFHHLPLSGKVVGISKLINWHAIETSWSRQKKLHLAASKALLLHQSVVASCIDGKRL